MRVLVLVALAAGTAAADPMTGPITSRTYRIDLYDGVVLGNSEIISMGGASAANASGSSGTLVNPSAPAVRHTTDHGWWGWDYHFDYLNASLSQDYSNSGLTSSTTARGGTEMLTLGASLRIHDWAGAITLSRQTAPLVDAMVTLPNGNQAGVDADTQRGQLAVAKWFPAIDTAIGVDLQIADLELRPSCGIAGCGSLFDIQGLGLEAGATWIPRDQDFRIGAAAATPISGGKVVSGNCDPNNCEGYILPDQVHVPWRFAAGAAYRFGPTAWNHQVPGRFRDERAVTVALDLDVTGRSPDAYGLEAFGLHELERSGRHTSYSVRAGAEYEWLPGRLRVRAGTYWEPGRFVGVGGRLHVTFGIAVRVFQFDLWGPRRGRITLTGDLAPQYDNLGLSIGFWH